MSVTDNEGFYSAEVGTDPAIGATALSLAYANPAHPGRTMVVSIAPELGSNLYRFRVGQRDLIYCDHELLKRREYTGNFVLWPLPNRIRDSRYTYQGQEYSLEKLRQEKRSKWDTSLIHGLVFDRAWQYEEPVITAESASVTTFIDITPESPYYDAYPFPSRLSLTYTLTPEGVHITYHVRNNGERDLPFGFALHPYFATLSGPDQTLVSLPAAELMEADERLLPTGRIFDLDKVMYAMYDLRHPVPVGNLKLDHVYTKLHPGEPAVIEYKQQGMQLHIAATADFTHAVIYTLGGSSFFCLEHQTCSTDAVNFHNQEAERRAMAHLLEVRPGETSTGTLHYTVHFKQEGKETQV